MVRENRGRRVLGMALSVFLLLLSVGVTYGAR